MHMPEDVADRLAARTIAEQVEFVTDHPVIRALMQIAGGLLAVLNDQRQVIAVNRTFLDSLNLSNPLEFAGLRPGEVLECENAHLTPHGCGSSAKCHNCGLALALVSSLRDGGATESVCAIRREIEGVEEDLFFRLRCSPMELEGQKLLMLFLEDATREQKHAILESVFRHDIANLVTGVANLAELLAMRPNLSGDAAVAQLNRISWQLAKETVLQGCLLREGAGHYRPEESWVPVAEILQDLKLLYDKLPIARGRHFRLMERIPDVGVVTDPFVVARVLGNMLANAFEAAPEGAEVALFVHADEGQVRFRVWNEQVIPPEVQRRIFQRNFSTKATTGRGWGTWSMKLFGEKILRGEVGFSSARGEGTSFWLKLPLAHPPGSAAGS